jgi:sugar phosphate isomerase/epimerase
MLLLPQKPHSASGCDTMSLMRRRTLLHLSSLPFASALFAVRGAAQSGRRFPISLAQWSLHRAIQSRMMSNLDFPRVAREQFGIEGLEFVNQLWAAPTQDYIATLKRNMNQTGTKGVLIMCDGEGSMGHSNRAMRMKAAENHFKWADAAAELGCSSIRVNMYGEKRDYAPDEVEPFLGYCSESFAKLCEFAKGRNLNVIIENHGGLSSDADVLVRLMKKVNLPNFGLLPDFGNFPKETDKYASIAKMMPYAKGVSFKCFDFGPDGNDTTIDMHRMMKIVADSGYRGWVGIEYEGNRMTEFEGIQAAKRFLDKIN